MRTKITLATLTAACALIAFPAVSQAALFIDAKSFSTQEATSLARSTIATFSDDHTPGTPCDASGYTSTVDWGDGSPVEPATVTFRFGGDFALCEFTVAADHKYGHFGVFTTTVSVSGGPNAHTGSDIGEITVADVNIAGAFAPFVAAAGTAFNGVVATFKDQNGLSQPGDFTSSIDWGDGTPVITGTIGGANGTFTVSGAHTYAAPGNYTVRTILQHPTGPPAVAVGTVTVGGAAPPAGGPPAGGGGTTGGALPTVQMRLLSSSLRKSTLRTKGMAVRLTVGNSKAKTLKVEILRNAKHYASSTLKLSRTDGKAQTVRWKPSRALLAKLKTGVTYGFRVSIGSQATAARSFRLSATPR
jgi:hypothetical protein